MIFIDVHLRWSAHSRWTKELPQTAALPFTKRKANMCAIVSAVAPLTHSLYRHVRFTYPNMQRNAFLPFWVCPSSMSSSIVLISVCSSQKCRTILFGLLFLRDSPQSTWFLPVSHFCTWSRCGCWRLGLPVSCGFFQSVRWCEGSLGLCGAVHCELLQQVLKSSLVPSWGGGGWMEQRVVSVLNRKAHVWPEGPYAHI